jgi:hypothetical protein
MGKIERICVPAKDQERHEKTARGDASGGRPDLAEFAKAPCKPGQIGAILCRSRWVLSALHAGGA